MSMRIVKESPMIHQPNDEVAMELRVMKSGHIQLVAPAMHPKEVCKALNSIVYDLLYGSLQMQESPATAPSPLLRPGA